MSQPWITPIGPDPRPNAKCPLCGYKESIRTGEWVECQGCKTVIAAYLWIERGRALQKLEADLAQCAAGPWMPAKNVPEDTPVLWWWPGQGASVRKLIGPRTATDGTKWYRLYHNGTDRFDPLKEKDLDEMLYTDVRPPKE